MGFDLTGRAARSAQGEYFRNSVWWWHPLADYVLDHVTIPENDPLEWHSNGGYEISENSAHAIAERLSELLASGEVARFMRTREKVLAELPDVTCDICEGRGHRDRDICGVCDGKGRVRPWATNCPFDADNVAEFAAFCRDSGGFVIG